MNVLSIDIDFITEKYSNDIMCGCHVPEPHIKWWHFFNKHKMNKKINFEPNYENFSFILDIFNSCVNDNSKVMFAINHDSILLELDKIDEKMDIINIDQHHDILYGESDKVDVERFDLTHCGSWVWYLQNKKNINSYTWIKNKTSNTYNEGLSNSLTPSNYSSLFKEEITFDIKKMNFDFIFVCLSPEYVLPEHWSYYHILRNMYSQKIGKEVQYIQQIPETDPKFLNFDAYKNIVIE